MWIVQPKPAQSLKVLYECDTNRIVINFFFLIYKTPDFISTLHFHKKNEGTMNLETFRR